MIDRDEREYRAAMRRLRLLERRIKLAIAALFIVLPFLYILGAAVAEGFGAHPADLPWRVLLPFMACGLAIVFNLDLREVLALFGNIGVALSKPTEKDRQAVDTEEEEGDAQ